jgi:hypothetical protein
MTNIIFTTLSSAGCIQRIKRLFINASYQDRNFCMCTGAVGALRCDFPTNLITDTVLGYSDIISLKCENWSVLQVPRFGCCIARKCVQRECGGPESGNWALSHLVYHLIMWPSCFQPNTSMHVRIPKARLFSKWESFTKQTKILDCVCYLMKAHKNSFFFPRYFFNVPAKMFACGVLRLIQHVVADSAKCVCVCVLCRSV